MKNIIHESAEKHVSGKAIYVDDLPTDDRLLSGKIVCSPHARASIKSFNLDKARRLDGVKAVLSCQDIPGINQMGPVVHDEQCLAEKETSFIGQVVFLIAAETDQLCRDAEKLIEIEYEPLPARLTLQQAIENDSLLGPERKISRGDASKAISESNHELQGTLQTGGQEHWYLETQISLAIPAEDNDIKVYSSTQHPSETQAIVAEVLGISRNEVTVEVRRMGGAFGGKETQANHIAAWTALLCRATASPVKLRLNRDEDQLITGKRHPFLINYRAGFNEEGKINGVQVVLSANGGAANDLSFAILERGMLHAENAYYIPHMDITGRVYKTNQPSNVAFRGFGAPQAIAGIELIIDRIASFLHKDAAEIRALNFYDHKKHCTTPYGQKVENNHLTNIFKRLMSSSDYINRKKSTLEFNKTSALYKRGIALTPVKFGISFTTSFLNQAGALLNIYQDGTIQISHGGTEMGQGLHTKIRQIAAHELGLDTKFIKVIATDTAKVPNTSATAASSGTDLNGMAVLHAIEKIKVMFTEFLAEYWQKTDGGSASHPGLIWFKNNQIGDAMNDERVISFSEAVKLCYLNQLPLSATGFYRTPNIHFNRETGQGRPFHYFAFGMAVSEVEVDVLTGQYRFIRTDILHDVGDSINPHLDRGQIEGGFIQGAGWCTSEELRWDSEGNLLTYSPDTYKIPAIGDIPEIFNVSLLTDAPNELAILNSKAVGEPPFVLGLSVWLAIRDAIVSTSKDGHFDPVLNIPATPEAVLAAIDQNKKPSGQIK